MIFTFNSERSPIIDSKKLQEYFKDSLNKCNKEIIVCSAFIKLSGIKWFFENIKNKNVNCRVISRWDREDLLKKVSDIEVYEFCKEKGWKFEIIENLHAKFYLMDKTDLISGSLNLTAKGMGLVPISNKEFGFYFKALEEDLTNIKVFLEDAIEINDKIYEEYKKYVEENKNFFVQKFPELPNIIKNLKEKKLQKIWLNDFLFTEPKHFMDKFNEENEDIDHDKKLFDIYDNENLTEQIKSKFRNLDIYKWFINKIKNKDENFFYYGELSALIHNSLFDDPKPFRKDIKTLQTVFFNYIDFLKLEEFKIERPNHSQKITYIG